MDWSNEKVLRFLELYIMHPCIWNPKDKQHKDKRRLNNAWVEIQDGMGEPCKVAELKKKRESLMSAYRAYRTKIKHLEASGTDYRPSWFAYDLMDSFLADVYSPSVTETLSEDFDDTSQDAAIVTAKEPTTLRKPRILAAKRKLVPELLIRKQMDETLRIMKSVGSKLNKNCEEEDECFHFGKIIAKKLRKMPEDRRDMMMIKMQQMLYDECHECDRNSDASASPSYITMSMDPNSD